MKQDREMAEDVRFGSCVTRTDAWSGGAIIAAVVVVLIVLGLMIYGVSKAVTNDVNHYVGAPHDWSTVWPQLSDLCSKRIRADPTPLMLVGT